MPRNECALKERWFFRAAVVRTFCGFCPHVAAYLLLINAQHLRDLALAQSLAALGYRFRELLGVFLARGNRQPHAIGVDEGPASERAAKATAE